MSGASSKLLRTSAAMALAALAATASLRTAQAHPSPASTAVVSFDDGGATIALDVPVSELELALHERLVDVDGAPEASIAERAGNLATYAAAHVTLAAPSGARWPLLSTRVEGRPGADGPRALFRMRLEQPTADASNSVELTDDLVAHEVVTHTTFVFVEDAASDAAERKLVGTLRGARRALALPHAPTRLGGFVSALRLGGDHIARGTDHLLFLFALLVVAPFVATRGAWRPREDPRATLAAIARVVTAFTVGHSTSLFAVVLGGIAIPSRPVEVAIAASIVATAVHALRPTFPRREALVAGSFGLVHGLAFSAALAPSELGRIPTALTLLGFNVGIELAQLGILALFLPWMMLLARTRSGAAFRVGAGTAIGVLGAGWLVERATSMSNPAEVLVGLLERRPLQVLGALAILATLGTVIDRLRPAPASPHGRRSEAMSAAP